MPVSIAIPTNPAGETSDPTGATPAVGSPTIVAIADDFGAANTSCFSIAAAGCTPSYVATPFSVLQLLTSGGAVGDHSEYTSQLEHWLMRADSVARATFRFMVDHASDSLLTFGMCAIGSTQAAIADGVYLRCPSGSAILTGYHAKASVSTNVAGVAIYDSCWTTVDIKLTVNPDGDSGQADFFVNGYPMGSLSIDHVTVAPLFLFFGLQAGATAAAKTLQVDYVGRMAA